ncbi:MAG TPA: nucleotidyltransferase domain-containing protein [bacterium]|nr:nucleotidyltransferase domain-containing protein [bacterium]
MGNDRGEFLNKRKEIIDYLEDYFKKNAGRYKIEIAFLYGSWAGGFPRLDSDIDIAIVFSKDLSEDDIFEYMTNVSLLLSGKFRLEVNIIPIYSDFREPMLYYNAIVLGITVFFRDFSEYVNLKQEAIFQMEDFSIFGRDWQINVARNNLEVLKRA